MGLRLLFLVVFLVVATSGSNTSYIVTTLPGYSGELPFTLETGYIGVGDNETVQLFYYFVESQRSPSQDPLLIWLSAGPGCSGLSDFFFESGVGFGVGLWYRGLVRVSMQNFIAYQTREYHGPLTFKLGDYNGSLPTLQDNPWAWTQGLNIIYLDAPVGAGFSYSKSLDGYYMDDYKYVAQIYEFIQKWLTEHPQFLENQFYVGGESFSGGPVPMIVQQIVLGNEAGSVPMINLTGYVLGAPATDAFTDKNCRVKYAHRLALISDQLYESATTSCNGNFVNVDSSNYQCSSDIDAIDKSYNHMLCSNWANNRGVQEALGVREGTKTFFQYCNTTLSSAYTQIVTNVVGYHRNLTNSNLRLLIYSGDHDMQIPNIGTQEWIKSLNLSMEESWRVWSVEGQTAGYTKKLINENFNLTYATVKGGGHLAAETNFKECGAMIDRWMAYFPL
ncbi:Serine carboxypeptidase-like 18 [Morella rubra]|uniref:Serine carboxypeptidase-like 18 n=1 Tax=Morella rubra TaxID=262757 RepID=A0A6A1VHP0_9ROSI|nr:Serine carboxypeptidase-like 18 [Morella rubra]